MNQRHQELNGKQEEAESALRLTIIAPSIVSDIGNPLATTLRAVTRALIRLGHEVTVWEERRNQPLRQAMALHGAAPMRAFYECYPDIPYRTYELPSQREMALWLSFQVAISDAVLALRGVPEPLWRVLGDFDASPAVKLMEAAPTRDGQSIDLVTDLSRHDSERVSFGPAVLPEPSTGESRSGELVVIYDENDIDDQEQEALLAQGCRFVRSGAWQSSSIEYVPEVDLKILYQITAAVRVTGAGDAPAAIARQLLPVAAGCAGLSQAAGECPLPGPLPVANDANKIASDLVAFIGARLPRNR